MMSSTNLSFFVFSNILVLSRDYQIFRYFNYWNLFFYFQVRVVKSFVSFSIFYVLQSTGAPWVSQTANKRITQAAKSAIEEQKIEHLLSGVL